MKKILKTSHTKIEGKRIKAIAADGDSRREKKRRPPTAQLSPDRSDTFDETELTEAMAYYKRDNCRQFPTWSEVLEVLCALGYRKVAAPTQIPDFEKRNGIPGAEAAEKSPTPKMKKQQ